MPAGESGQKQESNESEDDGNDAARIVSWMSGVWVNARMLTEDRGIRLRS
jgi:hypothetical protein